MLKTIDDYRKWWILVSVAICLAVIFIDQTAVAVILPQLHRDLGLSDVGQQWVVNSYLLTWVVLTLIGGRFSDIFGNRRMFLLGMVGFLFASVLCGVAPNGTFLIMSRVLQGAFGAILSPNTAVSIINAFPSQQRGTAIGIYAGSASIFMTLGPVLGGFFTQFLSWRLVFWINVPLCLFSIALAMLSMPKVIDKVKKEPIDWLGFFVSGIATAALIVAVMEGVNFGWTSPIIISLFVTAFLAYLIFFILEKYVSYPLVDLQIFQQKNYSICLVIRFCLQMCAIVRIFYVIFFQLSLGCSPLLAGLLILPSTVPTMIVAPLSGRLLDRFGPRLPIITGLLFVVLGLFWTGIFAPTLDYWKLFLGIMFLGIGLPLAGNPNYTVALSVVDRKHRGIASGIYNQMRQFSGSLGIAVIGAIITNLDSHYFVHYLTRAGIAIHLPASVTVDSILSGSKIAHQSLANLSPQLASRIYHLAAYSYSVAFHYGLFFAGSCAFITLILAIAKFKKTF